jgi:hypothetical protein
MKHVYNFNEFINEDGGVANATAGNGSGMGAIVAPTVSAIPGDTAGSIAGSGDIPASMGAYTKDAANVYSPKKKKKKTKITKFSQKFQNNE